MNILYLGKANKEVIDFITFMGDTVHQVEGKIDDWDSLTVDFIVSYGYRYKVPKGVTEAVPCINLHISYLPWNKGADPNFWSWKDNTIKGVTIHRMDEGIDTGNILAQREVELTDSMTLRESYAVLQDNMVSIFYHHWPWIRINPAGNPQSGEGSYHRSSDKDKYVFDGWLDVPIKKLLGCG